MQGLHTPPVPPHAAPSRVRPQREASSGKLNEALRDRSRLLSMSAKLIGCRPCHSATLLSSLLGSAPRVPVRSIGSLLDACFPAASHGQQLKKEPLGWGALHRVCRHWLGRGSSSSCCRCCHHHAHSCCHRQDFDAVAVAAALALLLQRIVPPGSVLQHTCVRVERGLLWQLYLLLLLLLLLLPVSQEGEVGRDHYNHQPPSFIQDRSQLGWNSELAFLHGWACM
mmetsp:Transcript_41128/g.88372  ORF Transcript_41128/g.88372 Transcript_41128/m.88372 type:complete len:225 (+) Transcript_41128:911-1585(+)